jgi:D-tyrosyl-tRNA(Tyr) deacylase
MRALVQRVSSAQVEAGDSLVGRMGRGLLVYVGVAADDTVAHADKLADKLLHLRVFEDADENMNLSVQDIGGDVLAVPNFTLVADAGKGRRPSFAAAARPEHARKIYERLLESLKSAGLHVACGAFREHMHVRSVADGPVNMIVDLAPEP